MKAKLTILIGLLVLYPTLELTRLIAIYDPFGVDLAFELCLIWAGYISAMCLIYRFTGIRDIK